MIGGLIALSMILTGTGYAYWTDTLNVTTRATTGELAVTFVDLGLYAQYENETLKNGWSIVDGIGESGYVDDHFFMRGSDNYNIIATQEKLDEHAARSKGYNNVTFDAELVDADYIPKTIGAYNKAKTKGSGEIEISINKMYPGYAQAYRADILNIGDIAAKLNNMYFTVEEHEEETLGEVKDMLGVAVLVDKEIYKPAGHSENGDDVFKLCEKLALTEDEYFTVGQVDFLRLSALEKLDQADIKAAIESGELMCEPNDARMDLFLAVAMDPDMEGIYTTGNADLLNGETADGGPKDADTENKGVKVLIRMAWDQFNVGKDAGDPNWLVNQNKK